MRCYSVIALLGLLGILRPRLMLLLFLALVAIRGYRLITIKEPDDFHMLQLGSLFAGSAYLYLMRDQISFNLKGFLLCVLLMGVSTRLAPNWGKLLLDIALPYAVIYLGFLKLPLIPHFGKYGDFSYGVYLYAFPVQQLVLHLWKPIPFTAFMALSFAITLICAIASWHFIEKPALSLKT